MASSSSFSTSSSFTISPRKLRYDLYSYSYQEDSNTPLVVNVLASLIERSMARTQRIVKNYSISADLSKAIFSTNMFDCREEIPDMTIQSYLERIFRYTRAGPSVYVVAYVYIDRFCQNNPGFRINPKNVHRLLITTIMVASKYVEDMWVPFSSPSLFSVYCFLSTNRIFTKRSIIGATLWLLLCDLRVFCLWG